MRSHLEFRAPALVDAPTEDVPAGQRVAELLAAELPRHGYRVTDVHSEDWGWRVAIANAAFPLWIGCGHYEEYADGHLCFIEPSRPYLRRWLKRVATSEVVEGLAGALEGILHDRASDLRWWTEAEVRRG